MRHRALASYLRAKLNPLKDTSINHGTYSADIPCHIIEIKFSTNMRAQEMRLNTHSIILCTLISTEQYTTHLKYSIFSNRSPGIYFLPGPWTPGVKTRPAFINHLSILTARSSRN